MEEKSRPYVMALGEKTLVLRRRRDHLRRKLAQGVGSPSSLVFDKQEEAALSAALELYDYYARAGLEGYLRVAEEVVTAYQDGSQDELQSAILRLDHLLGESHES